MSKLKIVLTVIYILLFFNTFFWMVEPLFSFTALNENKAITIFSLSFFVWFFFSLFSAFIIQFNETD